MALTKITKTGIGNDAIDNADKIADDVISEEHIDVTAVTGHSELSAAADDNDVLLVFDTSANAIKKIQRSNVALQTPTFSSVSPSNLLTGDGTGNHTIVVTGTKFDATASFKLRTDGGTDISMDSVTRNSATQLTGVVAKSTANLTNANEPFDIIITNGSGLATTGANAINIDASPVFVTSAGSLGTVAGGASGSFSVNAQDPESNAQAVTFELQSGSLPAGLSLVNTSAEGGTAIISGTATNPTGNTTSNFVLRAVDAASNTTSRAFSITVTRTVTRQSFTSSGTFAVPSGMSSLSAVLVVAGGGQGARAHGSTGVGGGGAGGLVYQPAVTVTPGGTITVTVGDGADGSAASGAPATTQGSKGQNSVFGASPSPGISAAITAVGGGAGTTGSCQPNPSDQDGGSGGGGGYGRGGGSAQQPTQPGNSGAYGFGGAGGQAGPNGPGQGGAGGGGAGGAGGNTHNNIDGGAGGVGKAYTIADGTSPVFYAGGGGGSAGGTGSSGNGGQGGGSPGDRGSDSQDATANRGGGSGGTRGSYNAGAGGKGVVIVEY